MRTNIELLIRRLPDGSDAARIVQLLSERVEDPDIALNEYLVELEAEEAARSDAGSTD